MIRSQLPPDACLKTHRNPWANNCSFSFATRCPQAVWVDEFYQHHAAQTAVYVGCNKGMDAINALRMISANPAIDKNAWRDSFFKDQTIESGVCNQEFGEQFSIPASRTQTPAVVHCIEAMPITAAHLNRTAGELGLDESLIVTNAAMASVDGVAVFPNVEEKVGVEGMGLADCKKNQDNCKEVPLYKLDTYLEDSGPIDFISVDVEGYDFDVLLGANETLPHVRYLEFEYNWKGSWGKQKLSDATNFLKSHGFTCYWAGTEGHIWRITDCWLDYYDLHFWSNIACVNLNDPIIKPMARRMEQLFQETVAAGKSIQIAEKL